MRTDTTLLSQNRAAAVVALISGGFLLLSILVMTFLSPVYGLVGIGFLAGGLVALYFAFSLRKFVWLLLVTKPLIDLTWRWRFATVAEQGINVQTLIGLLVITVTALAIFLRRQRIVLDTKVIFLVVFAVLSVLFTPTSWGINELIRLITGVSFFFIAGVVLSEEDFFDRFAKGFILAVSVPVVLGLLQKFDVLPFEYWDWIEGQAIGRVSGTYQHPLGLIYFLVYAIPLALYLLTKPSQSLRYRIAFVVIHWPVYGRSGFHLSSHGSGDNRVRNLVLDGANQAIWQGYVIGYFSRSVNFLAEGLGPTVLHEHC